MDLCSISNGHLNLHARLDVDGGNLLDDLGGGVQVDDALVDPHLELVPGLGTLTARSLSGGDPEGLGRHPHWALHLQLLVLGAPDQVLAHLLQGLHILEVRVILILWTGASSSTPFPSLYAAMILVELVTVVKGH